MNSAGKRSAIVRLSLCGLLILIMDHADLSEHAHEIVKKILFHDLALFVPACDRTEINVEAFVRGWDDGSVGHSHCTLHCSSEIGDGARPFTLSQHNLVWIVDEVLVREHLEECNSFLFVGVDAMCGWLIGPAHNAIFGVIFAKGLQVLRIPGIIQLFHVLQIGCSVHDASPLFLAFQSSPYWWMRIAFTVTSKRRAALRRKWVAGLPRTKGSHVDS